MRIIIVFFFVSYTFLSFSQVKSTTLPQEFLGDWCYSLEENLAEHYTGIADFNLINIDGLLILSFGTDMGGYDLKVKKENENYIINYKARSEGEEWDASLMIYILNNNLYIDLEAPFNKDEATKMNKCEM